MTCLNPPGWYVGLMTQAVAHILAEAEQLSLAERTELADRLAERIALDVPVEFSTAQLSEVRRRIAEVESGAVTLIPGGEALAKVQRLLVAEQVAH